MALRTGTEQGPREETGQTVQEGLTPWSTWQDDREYAPDLRWPGSVSVYERMATDGQVGGLKRSVELPVQRYHWSIDPQDADEESARKLADDLNLPLKGEEEPPPRRRGGNRFSFKRHLQTALKALWYGHRYFEQVGEVDESGFWHLRKLADRAPHTIGEISVEKDGGLRYIKQNLGVRAPEIPVTKLLVYVWDQEDGNWVGKSMLRACYRDWLIKDRLYRVNAVNHERNGAGIPYIEAPPGASQEQIDALDAMARSLKAHETGGGAVPAGAKLHLAGLSGSVPDAVESIRYHNEEMAGSFLAMFKQLGQTQTGSRALGDTFVDFFDLALLAIADWIADTFNAHMVEDWYDWNYGPDAEVAALVYDVNAEPSVSDLKALIDSGAIQVDEELENEVRKRHNLPEREGERVAPQPPAPSPPAGSPEQPEPEAGGVAAAQGGEASPSLPLPDRPLRRQPYEHEIRANVDFAKIDVAVTSATDQVVTKINQLKKTQIQQLHDQIIEAGGDVKKLRALSADPVAEKALYEAMEKTAGLGVETASAEAKAQGRKGTKAQVSKLAAQLSSRAQAVDALLANALTDSALRQAIRLSAPTNEPSAVAGLVKAHLEGLSDKYLHDQVNGALNGALNTGRKATMNLNDPTRVYASELLDEATCDNCVGVDGEEYASVTDAESEYPTGGYGECLGGERCRGTLVAVYEENRS